ncbi:hypothetical protein DSO57_1035890 [Entomophthora muscae]|uniref:Uncharacterized protein n=1 Tax=Entomophthora muscae TaxID=34485 RepID=A0ACC2SZN5_9FUNG|nr:hypothetical protein DSO57_1035890 [Entomophthora muscae]
MKASVVLGLATVGCWTASDLLGTYVSVDGGCQDANELHFGDKEVFVKRYCKEGQENQLIRGHWYRSNDTSILEGEPKLADLAVSVQFTPDYIIYGNTKLRRATQPTLIDTLAMVGYGYYAAKDSNSNLKRVVFTEGEMSMFFDGYIHSGPWAVTEFTPTQVSGTLSLKTENIPIAITKISPTSLRINEVEFDLTT